MKEEISYCLKPAKGSRETMKDFTEELIFELDPEEGVRRLCIEAETCILIEERENSLEIHSTNI